jgi:glycosyltransferase involved in cell wall biosynthesis
MRIVHALQMPATQQGGLEVLVRTLIADSHPDDRVFLVSEDQAKDLLEISCRDKIAGHLRSPAGALPKSWNDELIHWLRKNQIDICHFHLAGTYDWGTRSLLNCPITQVARAGVLTVTTNHSATCFFTATDASRPTWRKWAAVAKSWPGKARQLGAVSWEASASQHDLAVSRRYFPNLHSKLIQIYHSRLDADLPVAPPRRTRIILNIGTVAFHKGQHLLAEAFARVAPDFPDWQLKLVGYCAEQKCVDQIQTVALNHGLQERIQLCGPDSEPSHLYEDAEIYVQPSLVEGLGLSLQEAMFHGRACIGSAVGGIPELILNPTMGILFPGGDVPALASALANLMAASDKRDQLGDAARLSILKRGMTRQAMSATYRNLYQQTIRSR